MVVAAGSRLGPYEIAAPIGAGGMGEVYRARDTRLGRDVAIKVLRPEFAADADRLHRFEKEARAASALNHPNILAVHDVGSAKVSLRGAEGPEAISSLTAGPESVREVEVHYLVEELLEGHTLAQRLRAGRLTASKSIEMAVQIAHGLAAAHEKGIAHRDLKPDNLFLTTDGQIKILDFGLAKLRGPRSGKESLETSTVAATTETGVVLGTVGYMSPEQIRAQEVDQRTDIFALGCVLYEMLSGKRAFKGETPADTMSAILSKDPPPLSSAVGDVPPVLEGIVSRCLEKRPADRFSSAHDLALALMAASEARRTPGVAHFVRYRRRWLPIAAATFVAGWAIALALDLAGIRSHLTRGGIPGPVRSIAVLPLANLSGDPAQEYFSDGMTDALIAGLAQIKALKVISRTSVMQYKEARKPLRQIAKELGVEGIIEGSVMRSGGRVRITAQLIDAHQDRHLWASNYEREMTDVLALQSEVVRAIVGEIRVQVTPQEEVRLASVRPVDPEAYELCLKGWHIRWKDTPEGFLKAVEYFQRAINVDPSYAPAHAGLSDAYFTAAQYNVLPFKDLMSKAKAAARRALELDEGLAEAHVALAVTTQTLDWDWAGAEREYRRALELDPNGAVGLTWYGWYLTSVKRFDEAVALRKRLVELDPLSVSANDFLGWTLYYAGRYDESIGQYRKALEMDPKNAYLHMWLARSYASKQERNQALAACRTAMELAPEDLIVLTGCGYNLGISGNRQEARAVLDRVNLLAARKPVDPCLLAWLYVGVGDKERALELLEEAFQQRSPNLAGDPDLDFGQILGSDPRYQTLRRRLNLPASAMR